MLTEVDQNIHKEVTGFVINSGFSRENQKKVQSIQDTLAGTFNNSVWLPPPESLHITLMDWFAPLVAYGETQEALFKKHREEYEKILKEILKKQSLITVHFDTIITTPSAVIIRGTDDGSYKSIRNAFMDSTTLVPGTKLPPAIIHSSIGRFTGSIELDLVKECTDGMTVDFLEVISEFRLVKEREVPMLTYDILRSYTLE